MANANTAPRRTKDNGTSIPDVEWEDAVSYLVQSFPLETWAKIQQAIRLGGLQWHLGQGRILGRTVRYILDNAGFRWGAVCIHANWFRLLEEGAERVVFVTIEYTK